MKRLIIVVVFASLAVFVFSRLSFDRQGNAQEIAKILPETREKTEDDLGPAIAEKWEPVCTVYLDAHPSFKNKSAAFSPDMKYFAVSNKTSSVLLSTNLYDLQTGEILMSRQEENARNGKHFPVAFSPDCRLLAFDGGKEFVIWDIAEKNVVTTMERLHEDDVFSRRFSDDGKRLWSVIGNNAYAGNGIGHVWDAKTGKSVKVIRDDSDLDNNRAFFVTPIFRGL